MRRYILGNYEKVIVNALKLNETLFTKSLMSLYLAERKMNYSPELWISHSKEQNVKPDFYRVLHNLVRKGIIKWSKCIVQLDPDGLEGYKALSKGA